MPAKFRGSSPLPTLETLLYSLPSSSSRSCSRSFTTTPCREKMSRARQSMYNWINSREGRELANNTEGRPRYLGQYSDQPFPLNPLFRSQPVLDEHTKELIWEKVTQRGEALKAVSAEMGVDVRRVAAVVRLKQVEKQWVSDGKKLATPYAKAVMSMLPKTSYREGEQNTPHEPVNDVHVHKYTMQQLFVPVSESRQFNREDAAQAFHDTMLSADARSPQRGLIKMEKEILGGKSRKDGVESFNERAQKEEDREARRLAKLAQAEEDATSRIKTDRYEFRFKEMNVDDSGAKGKSRKGTGWRYGAPHDDRKRGLVKIPTSVP